MTTFEFASINLEDIFKQLNTSRLGLNETSVQQNLSQYGTNEIKSNQLKWWNIFFKQFKSSFIYLLIGAAILAIILGETLDGVVIFIFISINTLLGFFQEFRSEQALKMLQTFIVVNTRVIRNGEETVIDSKLLVPGDIVVLETGDQVPADIRVIETNNVSVNESILTGESMVVNKNANTIATLITNYYGADNLLFSGSTITNGKVLGIVVNTGINSCIGNISHLTIETQKQSAFTKGLSSFSNFILKLIIVTLIFVFIANLVIKKDPNIVELLIFSIALAVSVIPEALPLVTTLSLSRGALQLAKNKVVVRRLSAIEDLGGIEILCTDKTGTITKNELTINEVISDDRDRCLLLANLGASALKDRTEPFDIAVWNGVNENQQNTIVNTKQLFEEPFNPNRRRSLTIVDYEEVKYVIVRGAVEVVLPLCANVSDEVLNQAHEFTKSQGYAGNRLFCIAYKTIPEYTNQTTDELEESLTYSGLISFIDPIKETTIPAIQKAEELGLQIKIITGDSAEVAGAVGTKIGLITDACEVITGNELFGKSTDEQINLIEKYHIFARITPEQKYSIIRILQSKHEVGFLGEGINDAPALKAAGVAIVVPSASGIAREASDIALLENNLEVIVTGIKEGRKVFANTIKYLKSTLASNFGNFYAVAIGSLIIDFLPMLPLQLLLLNLLSDFPMIAIASDNVDSADIAKPQHYNVREVVFLATILGIVSSIFDFMFFGIFYRISPGVLQTNWFIGSILTELVFTFSVRTKLLFYKGVRPSWIVLGLSVIASVVTVIIPFTLIGQTVFKFIAPQPIHLALIFSLVILYFTCTEIVKHYFYRFNQTTSK